MRFALPLLMVASAAQAGTFAPPEGCTAHLTVQGRSCIVAHYWTCEGNAAGVRWHAEMDQNGIMYIGQIDNEAQWLKSYFVRSNEEETLIEAAKDPADLTNLLNSGTDTFEFSLNTTTGVHRVVGFDRIIERNVKIDGQTLHRTEYNISTTNVDGTVVFAAKGNEYVSETYRRFFSGAGTVTEPDAPFEYNETPVDFITRGQPGFLSDEPIYDCNAITARHETQQKDPQP
jgi:hypothetical protein